GGDLGVEEHDGGHVAVPERVLVELIHGLDRVSALHFRHIVQGGMLGHVPDGENIPLYAAVAVRIQGPARIGLDADVFQAQAADVRHPAHGNQGRVHFQDHGAPVLVVDHDL